MEDDTEKVVFTGDTLFIGGWCFRLWVEFTVALTRGV